MCRTLDTVTCKTDQLTKERTDKQPQWSTVLENLAVSHLNHEIPRTLRKLTVPYRVHKSQINPVYALLTGLFRSILVLSSDMRLSLPNGLIPSRFPRTKSSTHLSYSPCVPHILPISIFFYSINRIYFCAAQRAKLPTV